MFSDNTDFFYIYADTQTPHIFSEAPAQHTSAWAPVAGIALVAVLVLVTVAVVESVIIWHQQRYAGFTMLPASLPHSPLYAEIISYQDKG